MTLLVVTWTGGSIAANNIQKYPISTECNKALQKMLLYEVTNNIYRRRIAIAKGEGAVVISAFSTEHGKVGAHIAIS